VAEIPDKLVFTTFSARRIGALVVWVGSGDLEIADADWEPYVKWCQAIQRETGELKVLTTPFGHAPSPSQRSLLDQELDTERMRVAVMLSNPKLVAVVRAFSWFIKGITPFKAHELEKALAFLGESDTAGVRAAIHELGGKVTSAAR
jgi:hypothetical protein